MNLKTGFREWMFRTWYWYVNKVDKKAEILFMNFGYSDKNKPVKLQSQDEHNRYSIQLYHHLASAVDLKGKDIIEIGCGRGGGLAYITKSFSPSSTLGIDLDKRAIAFNNKHYSIKGLSFLQGHAQKIPLSKNICDVIFNVESSHRYSSMELFLSEVYNLLRPKGFFLFTDFRYDHEIPGLLGILRSSGLTMINKEFITPQVINALESDDGRRRKLVAKLTPRFLHRTALNFAGTIGSQTYNQFVSGKYVYFNFILQKS